MGEDLVFEPIPGLPDWRAAHVASIGSTNAELIARVEAGKAGEGRLWLTAGEQTAGRGRRGRSWSSPAGNLYASLALIDPAPPEHVGLLPLVAALAVRDAVAAELEGVEATVALKWPNDVLIEGAKCCGILLEATVMPDGRQAIVIGCGINIGAHPLDTPIRPPMCGRISRTPMRIRCFSTSLWLSPPGSPSGTVVATGWQSAKAGLNMPSERARRSRCGSKTPHLKAFSRTSTTPDVWSCACPTALLNASRPVMFSSVDMRAKRARQSRMAARNFHE